MSKEIEQEINAIKTLLDTLEPLDPDVRETVVEYVFKRLKIAVPYSRSSSPPPSPPPAVPPGEDGAGKPIHIRDFKEQKKPRSANEMAVLVAYYLSELVPEPNRKATINRGDLETQFKIADFPLPTSIQYTLPNAKQAGYLDSTDTPGEFKLNAVGHNLVVHNMPRSGDDSPRTRRKPKAKAKARTKKTGARKSAAKKKTSPKK